MLHFHQEGEGNVQRRGIECGMFVDDQPRFPNSIMEKFQKLESSLHQATGANDRKKEHRALKGQSCLHEEGWHRIPNLLVESGVS